MVLAELIDDEYSKIECVMVDLKLRLSLDEPRDEDLPHGDVDFGVLGHEITGDVGLVLLTSCVALDVFDVWVDLRQ